jgi:hypothetical protein
LDGCGLVDGAFIVGFEKGRNEFGEDLLGVRSEIGDDGCRGCDEYGKGEETVDESRSTG